MANNFNLTLDTLGPSGSITRPAEFINANGTLTITASDTSTTANLMKVWFNTNSEGTKSDAGYTEGSWEAIANKSTNFSTDGTYYYHVVFMDAVNNESSVINTERIVFDTANPSVIGFYMKEPDTGSTSYTERLDNEYGFDFADTLSGAASYEITGDDIVTITGTLSGETSGTVGPTDFSFKQNTKDGTKTITITLYDRAGNSTTTSCSIELNRFSEDPIISLLSKADSPAVISGDYINYHDIYAEITGGGNDVTQYVIYEGETAGSYETVGTYAINTAYDTMTPLIYDGATYHTTQAITVSENTDFDTLYTAGKIADAFAVRAELSLSAGDGVKTVNAKVKYGGGTEKGAEAKTVTIDTLVPVVTISEITPLKISNVEGYKTSTVTFSVSDEGAGIAEWELRVNGTKVHSGTAAVTGETYVIDSSTTNIQEGANAISLWAKDNAKIEPNGKYNTNETTYASSLILDTTAPTASIGTLSEWNTEKPGFQLTFSDENASKVVAGVSAIYAWTSTVAEDQSVPSGASTITPTTSPMNIAAGNITGAPAQSSSNYMHAKVVDAVGNVTYAHQVYGFDDVAPTSVSAKFVKDGYQTTSAEISVTDYADATSGVKQYKMTGDITLAGGVAPGTWFNVSGTLAETISVTLTPLSSGKTVETKSVTIFLKDTAGNESAGLTTISTQIDIEGPVATLVLRTADDSKAQPSKVNIQPFAVRISGTDDGSEGGTAVEYKLWGAFNTDGSATPTSKPSTWSKLKYGSGLQYMLITGLYCTSTENETKEIYLQVRDNAENESGEVSQSFYYDTTPPTVNITSGPDYQQISKVHAERYSGTSQVTGKYADEVNFGFTPSETIQEYKCCAYLTQADAKAGSGANDAPILQSGDGEVYAINTAYALNTIITNTVSEVTTYYVAKRAITAEENTDFDTIKSALHDYGTAVPASINMHGVGTVSSAITSKLMGADYEAALMAHYNINGMTQAEAEDLGFTFTEGEVNGIDGLHYVVVYVKDEAGTWSAAATFEA